MGSHAVVVGAGIGGLTAAVALERAGLAVEVHERAPEVREVGAGITVQPNAIAALEKLGLGARVSAQGGKLRRGVLAAWRGRVLVETDLALLARELGVPAPVALHRATLLALLLEAVGPAKVRTGSRCTGYTADDTGVTVELDGGKAARGDVLIGADGIHSVVRERLHPKEPPRYSGQTCWRGVCQAPGVVEEGLTMEIWGPGARFGCVPIDGGRVYWFAPADGPQGGKDEPGATKRRLLERYAKWMPPVTALIEATPEDAILRNDLVDRPPIDRWGEGPVTLLGDAAHAMTPNMGQGACQAIEDALVLGHCLGVEPDRVRALRRYEDARRARARWFVERSWRFGQLAQRTNPVVRWLRDTVVALTPARTMRETLRPALVLPPLP